MMPHQMLTNHLWKMISIAHEEKMTKEVDIEASPVPEEIPALNENNPTYEITIDDLQRMRVNYLKGGLIVTGIKAGLIDRLATVLNENVPISYLKNNTITSTKAK